MKKVKISKRDLLNLLNRFDYRRTACYFNGNEFAGLGSFMKFIEERDEEWFDVNEDMNFRGEIDIDKMVLVESNRVQMYHMEESGANGERFIRFEWMPTGEEEVRKNELSINQFVEVAMRCGEIKLGLRYKNRLEVKHMDFVRTLEVLQYYIDRVLVK